MCIRDRYDIDAADGTVEQVLQNGVYPDAKYKAVVTGEDTALLVFIGDVPDRLSLIHICVYIIQVNKTISRELR